MNLLFLDGASCCHYDVEGNIYVDNNVNGSIIKRYRRYCDSLTIILQKDERLYSVSEAQSHFNAANLDMMNIVTGPRTNNPRINALNPMIKLRIMNIVKQEVQKADRIIVRAPGRFYSDFALRMCRKYNKLYLVEAVEFGYESRRYGKKLFRVFAPYVDFMYKRGIASAPYVSYVTQRALQERYPTNGKSLGCSDVELQELDPSILEKRIAHKEGHKIIFGTAGGVYPLKGQEYVVRALAELRKQGITNIEYHLAGSVEDSKFEALIKSLDLQEQVKLFGTIPHGKIFDWYDHLDAYIQPSFSEGLCRSLVEAMSRALPVTSSNAGGNPELVGQDMLFEAGNVGQICDAMKKMLDPELRKKEAMRSFAKAEEFLKSRLDPIRDKFYMDFINGN